MGSTCKLVLPDVCFALKLLIFGLQKVASIELLHSDDFVRTRASRKTTQASSAGET